MTTIQTFVAPSSPSDIVGYRWATRRRLDVLAVTTVTGTPSCSTCDGRSRCSQCDTRAGSVAHDFVERLALERLRHRYERVGVADEPFNMAARRVLQHGAGELQG